MQSEKDLQDESARSLGNCDVIVDAILGTGFRPPVNGLYASAIRVINDASSPIVAVDVPSGCDSDSMSPQNGEELPAPMRS